MTDSTYRRAYSSRAASAGGFVDSRIDRLERSYAAERDREDEVPDGDLADDADVELDDDEAASSDVERPSYRPAARKAGSGVAPRRRDRDNEVPDVGALLGGKYRVERVLEKTDSVALVQALDVGRDQFVTLKYLLPTAATRAGAVTRFVTSARTAAQLTGEHAARVLDVGRLRSGVPFVVTEELSGWELDEVLRVRGPLPVQEAVEYVIQAAEAVAEAHGLGIVHGSLNPGNLVLTRRPDDSPFVKVLGFGASLHEQNQQGDDAASFMGVSGFMSVLPYLAPEQIRSAEDVDDRADIWALGALLHTLLAGVPPFRGKTALALLAVVSADPPRSLDEIRDDISPDLSAAAARCLEKDRARRFANVGELVQALKPFASGDAQRSVERISRMYGRVTRPPPLPTPSVRSIVPVARTDARSKAAPVVVSMPPATASRWLLVAAVVGACAGAAGSMGVGLYAQSAWRAVGVGSPGIATESAPLVEAPARPAAAVPTPASTATSPAAAAAPPVVAALRPGPATTVVTLRHADPVSRVSAPPESPGNTPAASTSPVARGGAASAVAAAPRAEARGHAAAGSSPATDLFNDTR